MRSRPASLATVPLLAALVAGGATAIAAASPTAITTKKHNQLTVKVCGQVGRGCLAASAVTRGQVFYLLQQGYALSPVNSILNFVDTAPCPSVYSTEAGRVRAGKAAYIGRDPVDPGRFGRGWPVSATKSVSMPLGSDHVCSYMKELNLVTRRVTKPTYAHASATLTVKP
jgi:hypothetical protein